MEVELIKMLTRRKKSEEREESRTYIQLYPLAPHMLSIAVTPNGKPEALGYAEPQQREEPQLILYLPRTPDII